MSVIQKSDLNTFFAYLGTTIQDEQLDKQYLWKTLEVCRYNARNLSQLDESFFSTTLSLNSLENLSSTLPVAHTLREKFSQDPVIGAIPLYIQEGLRAFTTPKPEDRFGGKHLTKMLHYTLLGTILTFIYYAFTFFGYIAVLGFLAFGAYWGIKKMLSSVSKAQHEKQVIKTLRQNVSKNTVKIENMTVGQWQDYSNLSINLKTHLDNLKKQLILFSQIYPQKKDVDNIYMSLDIEKIDKEQIPLFIRQAQNGLYREESLVKTVEIMTKLVQSHLSSLIWENERDLNVTHRYWLNKTTEHYSVHEVVKIINE